MFLISCMDAVGPLVLIRRYSTTIVYGFIVDCFKAPCGLYGGDPSVLRVQNAPPALTEFGI